jgi:hypothetical protein
MDRGENKLNRPLLAGEQAKPPPKSCEDSFWDCLFCTCCDEDSFWGYEASSNAGYTNREGLDVRDFNVSKISSSTQSSNLGELARDEADGVKPPLKLTVSKLTLHTEIIKGHERNVSGNERTSQTLQRAYLEAPPDRPPSDLLGPKTPDSLAPERPHPFATTAFSEAKLKRSNPTTS